MDTNVVLQMFGKKSPFNAILRALADGHFEMVISNEIMLEYEELVTFHSGAARWQLIENALIVIDQLKHNIVQAAPQYRFKIVVSDPDDDKFADCAVVANAKYVVTEDHHFDVLAGSGYEPRSISPRRFIENYLTEFL